MKLKVLSLSGVEYEGEVESLNIKSSTGEITILNNHRPLITTIIKGVAEIKEAGGEKMQINVKSGFLEMRPGNELNVLVD